MRRRQDITWPLLVVFLASVAVWGMHRELIADLNQVFLADWGDGIYSNYSVGYHVKYDSTFTRFEGMNYPFGEQVSVSGSQPLLANTVKLISRVVDISGYTKAIMHGAILAGIVACSLLVFLIIRRKQVPPWYAVPAALGIAFLSPQLLRMGGHFGLAYTLVLPLCWWLALRFDERPSWRRSALLGAVVFMASGLHPYYLALTVFFLTFRWLFLWLQQADRRPFALYGLKHWTVQVFLPFVAFQSWLRLTDPVRDRPIPVGMAGSWEGVLVPPVTFPLGRWIENLVDVRFVDFESLSYVGLAASLFSIAFLAWALSRLRRRTQAAATPAPKDPELVASFAAALVMLLLAFGLPFVGLAEGLRDYTGPFRQLRALGRFTWAYFYVINVTTFVWLYWRGSRMASPLRRRIVWFLPLALLAYEAWFYNARIGFYSLARIPQLESTAPAPAWRQAIPPDRYQAIIPLPYFHVGSEFLLRLPTDESLRHTIVTSLLTGLPIMAVYSARTSWSQTLDNIELMQEPYREPRLWKRLDPERPFLIRQEKGEALTAGERWLLEASVPLYEDHRQRFLEIDLGRWRQSMASYLDSVMTNAVAAAASDSATAAAPVVVRSFDGASTTRAYRGSGALEGGDDRVVLFGGRLPEQDSVEYVLSAWIYLNGPNLGYQHLQYQERTPDGALAQNRSIPTGGLIVIHDGDWGMVEFRFRPTDPGTEQVIRLAPQRRRSQETWVDEILIRRASDQIVRQAGDEMYVNGRFYRRLEP